MSDWPPPLPPDPDPFPVQPDDPRRFPPDAPVVPNDAWVYRPPPPKCRRRFRILWRMHHVPMPEQPNQGGGSLVCLRCGARFYVVGSRRWPLTKG